MGASQVPSVQLWHIRYDYHQIHVTHQKHPNFSSLETPLCFHPHISAILKLLSTATSYLNSMSVTPSILPSSTFNAWLISITTPPLPSWTFSCYLFLRRTFYWPVSASLTCFTPRLLPTTFASSMPTYYLTCFFRTAFNEWCLQKKNYSYSYSFWHFCLCWVGQLKRDRKWGD